jgi:hypothetical protein
LLARLLGPRDERTALVAILVLLAGALIRLVFMAAWRPAFMGYPDAIVYIQMAQGSLFGDPIHAVGYPLFLRVLHDITPHLSTTIFLQHVLGLASGVLVYLTVRRAGGPSWLGLLPMAIVVLNGSEMFLEHSTLTEALYIFVESAALYAAICAVQSRRALAWAAVAGILLGVGATVRVVGLPLVPVFVVWLLLGASVPWRRQLPVAAAAAAGAAVVLGWFVIAQHQQTGYTGLTPRAGGWNLYARVAPFADCSKFTPPKGTQVLCESTPVSRRARVEQYDYDVSVSPAVKAFGLPFVSSPESNRKVAAFARAAILHQPLEYLETVAKGMFGYTQPLPPHSEGLKLGDGYEKFFHHVLFDPANNELARTSVLPYYRPIRAYDVHPSQMRFLFRYERATRIDGILLAILLVLSLLGPFVTQGRTRSAVVLIMVVTWVSLVVPVATHWWDSRTTVPVLGPLVAAAAFGGWGLVPAVRRARGGRLLGGRA